MNDLSEGEGEVIGRNIGIEAPVKRRFDACPFPYLRLHVEVEHLCLQMGSDTSLNTCHSHSREKEAAPAIIVSWIQAK